MYWETPPNDNGKYYFNEDLRLWEQLPTDEFGFLLTDDRINELRPYPSWQWSWAILDFIPPTKKPLDGKYAWSEEELSWLKVVEPDESLKPDDGAEYLWSSEFTKWIHNPDFIEDPYAVVWDDESKDYVAFSEIYKESVKNPDFSFHGKSPNQIWPSWNLEEDGFWYSPIPYPEDLTKNYEWDEYTQEWFEIVMIVDEENNEPSQ